VIRPTNQLEGASSILASRSELLYLYYFKKEFKIKVDKIKKVSYIIYIETNVL
jgi:hypothetical protein